LTRFDLEAELFQDEIRVDSIPKFDLVELDLAFRRPGFRDKRGFVQLGVRMFLVNLFKLQ
jgi:hypothetical protein